MALIKRKTRKRLTKDLTKLVKKHGAEMALALVTGIISGLAAEGVGRKKKASLEKVARPAKSAPLEKPEPRPIVVRKRAQA
jgi:hypothetical protein